MSHTAPPALIVRKVFSDNSTKKKLLTILLLKARRKGEDTSCAFKQYAYHNSANDSYSFIYHPGDGKWARQTPKTFHSTDSFTLRTQVSQDATRKINVRQSSLAN